MYYTPNSVWIMDNSGSDIKWVLILQNYHCIYQMPIQRHFEKDTIVQTRRFNPEQ